LSCVNRAHRKSVVGVRVRDASHYSRTDKWTLMLAIDAQGLAHVRLTKDIGTTKLIFDDFIRTLLPRLPPGGPPRTFIWDNLRAHYSDTAANMIYNAGHQVVPRPAYRPQDAPIEYISNQLEGKLRARMHEIHNDNDLVLAVHNRIVELSTGAGFRNTFRHCGYV
jgi:transposase